MVGTIERYPLTVLLIVALTINNMFTINQDYNVSYYESTLMIGILLSLVAEQLYQRFFKPLKMRLLLMGSALVVMFVYHLMIGGQVDHAIAFSVKTDVFILILITAFIWIPSIKCQLRFSQSFLVVFKAFFTTVLFCLIISIGISTILLAIDALLFDTSFTIWFQLLNVVGTLFGPVFFLTFIPLYIGNKDADMSEADRQKRYEEISRATAKSKQFDLLILFVFIPLVVVYTIVLLIYILSNLTSALFTENVLEPLLISYTITVLVIYLLASEVDHHVSHFFRLVIPKVLLPIVLFQTVASIVKINETGMTYGRYYVIVFGVFGTITGFIYAFLSSKKTNWLAPILIVISIISVTPPVDAFTVSRYSQINLVKGILESYNMLNDGQVEPNAEVSEADQIKLTEVIEYLDEMDDLDEVEWLPSNIFVANRFEDIFGFEPTYQTDLNPFRSTRSVNLRNWEGEMIDVSASDWLIKQSIDGQSSNNDRFTLTGQALSSYQLEINSDRDAFDIKLFNENQELITLDGEELLDYFLTGGQSNRQLTIDEAVYTIENDQAELSVIVEEINLYQTNYTIDFFLLIDLK